MTPDRDDPFISDTADLMAAAAKQLQDADRLMGKLERQQAEMLKLLHDLVEVVEKLEIERNAWRSRAEEMEKDRNRWQTAHNTLAVLYRRTVRLASELAAESGRSVCPECGSDNYAVISGEDEEYTLVCQECGHREEGRSKP